jgi:spermidine/putrescine transport system substrate-binding protein
MQRRQSQKAAAAARLSRRAVLKLAGMAAGAGAAAPWIVRDAFSSSGELNLMSWSGYDRGAALAAFTAATGIKVNLLDQADQESMRMQCQLSLAGGTIDVAEPSLDRVGSWLKDQLGQPWDLSRLAMAAYEPALLAGRAEQMASLAGQRYFLPSAWGSEALAHDKTKAPMAWPDASLGTIWDPQYEGKVTVRAHSSLAAMGRWLEAQGKLPKPWLASYENPDATKQLWDIALAEAIRHKKNIVQFWNGENDAEAAFRANGCTLGLIWDSTGYNLARDLPVAYLSPKEGAFGWQQGFFLVKSAKNLDQAHEWAKFIATPKGSVAWAAAFSANPVASGASETMDASRAAFDRAAFPDDALAKLWWWPAQPDWFLKLRDSYADKWKAA